jgi:hypothetical protein
MTTVMRIFEECPNIPVHRKFVLQESFGWKKLWHAWLQEYGNFKKG